MKSKVEILEILDAIATVDSFNKLNLEGCEFTYNNETVILEDDVLKEFLFIGLSNKDFVKYWFNKNSKTFENYFDLIDSK